MAFEKESKDLLSELTADYRRLQQQKCRAGGGIESRYLLNLGFLNDEHYMSYANKALAMMPQEENKLYLVFNLIKPRFNKLMGRLSSVAPPFKAQPDRKDPKAIEDAEVVDRLIRATDQRLNQPARTWELLFQLLVGGTAFEYTNFIPNASQEPMPMAGEDGKLMYTDLIMNQPISEEEMMAAISQQGRAPEQYEPAEELQMVGEVGAEIFGPLNVFIDQSVRSIEDLAPDQRVYVAKIRTKGWIEENFGSDAVSMDFPKELSIVSTKFNMLQEGQGGAFLRDLIPLIQGSQEKDDPQLAVVVDSYLPISNKNPHGRYEIFVPGGKVFHSDENPYNEIPITDYHFQPVTTSFWTPDYISTLIPAQKFINKRISQLGEQSNASIYAQLMLGGALKSKDIPTDFPGVIEQAINEQGVPLVQRLDPPQLPTWFMDSTKMVIQLFNDMAGGADLMQESKFPGQLRGPMAVPMLQEILDTEWGPLFSHLGERMAKVKQQRLNRVKAFYPPSRTLHYTDRDMKDEVMQFHTDKILRSGTSFTITVERGSLLPELRALREARVTERLSGPLSILYMDERTGRIDKSKVAADLQFGDTGREGRESQYRKLGKEIVEMMWKGMPVPPCLPFYDHAVMMDELESAMATTEFLKASPLIQQGFNQRWEEHRNFMMQEAQAQQAAMQSQMVHSAVAQATQQAAAQTAATTVQETMHQMDAQKQAQQDNPIGPQIAQAQAQNQPQAEQAQPKPKKRTFTIKREETS